MRLGFTGSICSIVWLWGCGLPELGCRDAVASGVGDLERLREDDGPSLFLLLVGRWSDVVCGELDAAPQGLPAQFPRGRIVCDKVLVGLAGALFRLGSSLVFGS